MRRPLRELGFGGPAVLDIPHIHGSVVEDCHDLFVVLAQAALGDPDSVLVHFVEVDQLETYGVVDFDGAVLVADEEMAVMAEHHAFAVFDVLY
jgi:hypothetical protein